MFDVFRRSYGIFTQSLGVLKQDKEILVFPLLSGIFTIIAFSMMAGVGVISGFFQRLVESGDRSFTANLLGYVATFIWYFVSWFIVIFFNVATIHCAKMRLDGGDPTVADGLNAASAHLGRIATWAAISATVGLILQVIRGRNNNIVARIASSLLGAAWSIATFFIVPVMIFERRSIGDSIKQSVNIMKKTWGESLVGSGGIGLFVFLLALPGIGLIVVSLFTGSGPVILTAIGLALVYFLLLMCMSAALGSIYRAALYVYATENRVPAGYSPEYVQNAFRVK